MNTLKLPRPVFFAISIVLAFGVVFLLFSHRRDASFNAVPDALDTDRDNYQRQAHSTRGEGIKSSPRFDDVPSYTNGVSAQTEGSTQKMQRLDFKATEVEIQHFAQPAPAALLEESAEYNREIQKVFDDLGLGDWRREVKSINRAFVGSLTPDELIQYLYLGGNGDHAAMDKFRQERGFYYPDEARRFPPTRKKRTSKRAPSAANTTTKWVQSNPLPHDDDRIGEANVKRSHPHQSQFPTTETMPNPHLETIPLTPTPFSPVQEIEQYIPDPTLHRVESDLPSNETSLDDDWLKTEPEPPATREHPRNNQPSPHGDGTREH